MSYMFYSYQTTKIGPWCIVKFMLVSMFLLILCDSTIADNIFAHFQKYDLSDLTISQYGVSTSGHARGGTECAGRCDRDSYCVLFSYIKAVKSCKTYHYTLPEMTIGIQGFDSNTQTTQRPTTPDDASFYSKCPVDWMVLEHKSYFFSEETRNWHDARKICLSYQANLVSIDSLEVFYSLKSLLYMTYQSWFTGGNDIDNEGKFVWDHNNTPLSYDNPAWNPGEPTNGTDKNCVGLLASTTWNMAALPCSDSLYFICQCP